MTFIVPNDIENETPADAVEVDQNFKTTQAWVNTNLINRDGSVTMTAPLHLFGDPISGNDAVRKAYVDAILPIGIVLPYGGVTTPGGQWALCNGASVQTALMPKLFKVIGYRFGGSGGSFKLPDLGGRIAVGYDTANDRFDNTGKTGGTWTAQLPRHRHDGDHNHPQATSQSQSQDHTHAMGAHVHPVNILSDDRDATHHHDPGNGTAFATIKSDGSYTLGGGGTKVGSATTTANEDATHKHRVQGNTGGMSNADRTGGVGQGHTHKVDIPMSSGFVTGYAGTDNVEHYSPYITLNYVIRTD